MVDVLIGGVMGVAALIQTLLPEFVTGVVAKECSEGFPAMCTSILASDRRDTGRDVLGSDGREKDLR